MLSLKFGYTILGVFQKVISIKESPIVVVWSRIRKTASIILTLYLVSSHVSVRGRNTLLATDGVVAVCAPLRELHGDIAVLIGDKIFVIVSKGVYAETVTV